MNRLTASTRTVLTRIVQVALVLTIVLGTAGFVLLQKSVTVSVDGTEQTVNTFAGTVGELLDRQGIDLTERDLVSPALDAPVDDGASVTVRYARLLTLVLDGTEREIWVTARSVDEALDQIGLRTDRAYLSSSRSDAIGRSGLELEMRTAKAVTIAVDGEVKELSTTALTVRDALDDAGVAVNAPDIVEPSPGTRLTDGAALAVKRVTNDVVQETIAVPFTSETRKDATKYEDYAEVAQAGVVGVRTKTYRVVKVDGVETYRVTTADAVTAAPVPEINVVGTKVRPAPPPQPPSPPSPPPPPGGGGGGAGVWDALAQCESGGNWSINTGNGYYGGLQFSYGTWLAYGGGAYGQTANLATKAQQILIAERLRADSGYYPWPACARKLGLI